MTLSEKNLRRPGFRFGTSLRLADGQYWTFPAPPSDGIDESNDDYAGLIRSLWEAEDEADSRRAELALAIHLLSRNYRVPPLGYFELLDGETAEERESVRRSLSEIAEEHAQQCPVPTMEWVSPFDRPLPDIFGFLRRLMSPLRVSIGSGGR